MPTYGKDMPSLKRLTLAFLGMVLVVVAVFVVLTWPAEVTGWGYALTPEPKFEIRPDDELYAVREVIRRSADGTWSGPVVDSVRAQACDSLAAEIDSLKNALAAHNLLMQGILDLFIEHAHEHHGKAVPKTPTPKGMRL